MADLLGRHRRAGAAGPGPVLELHAGTGVVTGPLTRAGVRLVAVEPAAEGRRQLRRALPGVVVVAARADGLPLSARSAAAVLVTGPELLASPVVAEELERVLATDGVLVLLARAEPGDVPRLPGFEAPALTEHDGGTAGAPSLVVEWRRS